MGINESHPCFANPCKDNRKVYVFSDTPHLIKLLRNHFLDSGILLNNNLLTKKPLEEVLSNQSTSDLKIAHRLTASHLVVKGGQRQKVKFATQLFSHTNSCALLRVGSLGIAKFKFWNELAILLKQVNDWFDLFNSRVPKIDSRPRMAAYGLAMPEQEEILGDMENVCKEMRIGSNKSLLPFQKGIITNIKALRMLFNDVKEQYNAAYILTYRLNQDPLEMFFGVIRAKGGLYDHPTALQFKYRLRSYLLGRNEGIVSQSANVERDNCKILQMDLGESMKHTLLDDQQFINMEETNNPENVLTSKLLGGLTEKNTVLTDLSEDHMSDLHYDGL